MRTKKEDKIFECEGRCEFPKIEGITFSCDKCIKRQIIPLSQEQKEKILVILSQPRQL